MSIVRHWARAENVIMLKIRDYMRRGKMSFLRRIRVAIELWGSRSTAETKTMKMPMIVMAKKN